MSEPDPPTTNPHTLQPAVTKTSPLFTGPDFDCSVFPAETQFNARVQVYKLTPHTDATLALYACADTTAQAPLWAVIAAWCFHGQITDQQTRTVHSRDLSWATRMVMGAPHGVLELCLEALDQDAQSPAPSISYAAWIEVSEG